MQADRTEQLIRARHIATTKLAGKSPQQRGQQKLHAALSWVYRWGWSSPTVLEQVGGAKRSGLAARLVRAGLLTATRTEAGGVLAGVPVTYLTLTAAGLQEVERLRTVLLPYSLDPSRVKQTQLRHDHLAQQLTISRLAGGQIVDFQTERELAVMSKAGVKQPDVVWHLDDGLKMGIEVELSSKWGRDLDGFVAGCVCALVGPMRSLNAIALFTDSPAILSRYQEAMTPGRQFGVWHKDERGHWQVNERRKVPAEIEGRFTCDLLS